MESIWVLDYSITFLRVFGVCLLVFSPILISFMILIAFLGWWIGKIEKWSAFDSLYCAFITATTVGYGDMKPTHRRAKVLAIIVAFLGLLFTGFIVTLGLHAGTYCVKKYHLIEKMEELDKTDTQLDNVD